MSMVPHQKGIFEWGICLIATYLSMKADSEEEMKVFAVTEYQILLCKTKFIAAKEALLFY